MKIAATISPTVADVTVRRLNSDEMAHLLCARSSSRQLAVTASSVEPGSLREWASWVAETDGQPVGSVLYSVVRREEAARTGRLRYFARLVPRLVCKRGDWTPRVELIDLAVAL